MHSREWGTKSESFSFCLNFGFIYHRCQNKRKSLCYTIP